MQTRMTNKRTKINFFAIVNIFSSNHNSKTTLFYIIYFFKLSMSFRPFAALAKNGVLNNKNITAMAYQAPMKPATVNTLQKSNST